MNETIQEEIKVDLLENEALKLLKKLNKMPYTSGYPQELLDKISFQSYHSKIIVGLQYDGDILKFVFVLTIPHDGVETRYLSIEEVEKIIIKIEK